MSDFTPGVERARAAGYAITVGAYPDGAPGIRMSLETIAKKIRDGRLDPDIRGWAGDVLIAAGRPKRVRDKVAALLNAFRDETVYVADPVRAEYIASAAATACLRPGLCVRARDCDDGCVFMGSVVMSIGIPARVVKQNFGPNKQEHVLIEAMDEDGGWFAVDPSTSLPVGQSVPAVSETRIDPMDVTGSAGISGTEIVTLGAVSVLHERETYFVAGRWTERRYGRWWVESAGLGWVDVGVGDACCAACAEGQPCGTTVPTVPTPPASGVRTVGQPASDDLDAPCSSCELYAERLRRRGAVPGLARPHGVGATLSAPAAPTVSTLGGAAAVGIAMGLALAGGLGWGLARRKAA